MNEDAHRGPNAANARSATPEVRQQNKRESNRIVDRIVELVSSSFNVIY